MIEELDDGNFLFYAASKYYNPRCSVVDDFYDDLHRIKYIKRLVNRYHEHQKISERLLLNHIIVFFNSFSVEGALKMLEFKLDKESFAVLKPFLVFLNYIEKHEYPDVKDDIRIQEILEKI